MKDFIDSVELTIKTNNGKKKNIPLEVLQVDAIAKILGLQVNISDLDGYKLSSQKVVDDRSSAYYGALKDKSINEK